MDVQQIGDRTFEISDLVADTDGDPATFANVVDIKIYTDEAEDSLLLLHHSFSKWTDGWIPNGGSEILTSEYRAYAKGDGMLIRGPGDTNRTASNQGARYDLDPQIFKVNHTYTFSTYVRYDENVGVVDEQNGNRKYVIFKFTLYDGLENGDASYSVIEQTKVYSGEWTHLMGTVTLPPDINPYGMYLIVESFDPPGQPFIGPYRFRMDEFAAAEGTNSISVDADTGIVHVTPSERVIYDDPFGNNDYDGWSAFRNTSLSTDQYNNDYYIRVANRNNGGVSSGIKKNVPLLVPGKEYRFTASLSGDDNTSTHNYVVSIDKINLDAGNAEWSNYKNIGETGSITGYNWGTIDTLYTIPEEAVQNEMYLYFETKQGSGDTKPFRVWNVRVTEPMDALENKAGYTLSGGTYISNYSQYGLEPAFDSATNPLHATSDYTADTGFSREVTLNEANQWKYNWTTGSAPPDITEETGYRYRYYIEEQWIGDSTNTVSYDSTDNVWRSNDGEYIVTYSGDMVATNDEETPITVSNRSIRYRLPQTGGRGRGRIYFFGSMLTAIGIISGSALYRRRRRRV